MFKGSNSADVRKLVSQTLEEYTDFFSAPPHARKNNVPKAKEKERQASVWNQFVGLKEQSLPIKEIQDICQPKTILQWQKVTQHLPPNIFSFCRRYLSYRFQQIPSYSDGKKISNESCTLCENVKQTQRHVISCCSKAQYNRRNLECVEIYLYIEPFYEYNLMTFEKNYYYYYYGYSS